eukprot:1161811-Pelagomonas_calceolata.AAC.4
MFGALRSHKGAHRTHEKLNDTLKGVWLRKPPILELSALLCAYLVLQVECYFLNALKQKK